MEEPQYPPIKQRHQVEPQKEHAHKDPYGNILPHGHYGGDEYHDHDYTDPSLPILKHEEEETGHPTKNEEPEEGGLFVAVPTHHLKDVP